MILDPYCANGDKFALLVLENVQRGPTGLVNLDLSATFLHIAGFQIDAHWKQWLGSILADKIARAKFFVLFHRPSTNPTILDNESKALSEFALFFLYGLWLTKPIIYDSATVLVGHKVKDIEIQSVSRVEDYCVSAGTAASSICAHDLLDAYKLAQAIEQLDGASGYRRVKEGFSAFVNGLRVKLASEKLHQFVRALDAVLKTPQGRGKQEFVNRTAALLNPASSNTSDLKTIFLLRSCAEHFNDWQQLINLPPLQRGQRADRYVRQAEHLARSAYATLLQNAGILGQLSTDANINTFWAQLPAAITARWPAPIDLAGVP